MTPYYQDEFVTLFNADFRDVAPTLEPVDHAIFDPPYAPASMKNARSAESIKKLRDGKVYDFKYAACTPELRLAASKAASRLAKRWTLAWCDIESTGEWRTDLIASGLRYVRTGVWAREHAAPQFSGDRPAQGVEACVIAHTSAKMRWNGGGRPAYWIGPIVNAGDASRVHTSPKPLWLMEAQIRDFTEPGDVIVDFFGGSGTTAIAAKRLGRRCIVTEIAEHFCEAIAKRAESTDLDERLVRLPNVRAKQPAMDFSMIAEPGYGHGI